MDKHSLWHTSWECIYHVVWIPKYRRRVLYGEARREIGEILRMLVDHMDGVEIVEGTACSGHIHICLRIALKHSAGHVVGRLKGKSAIVPRERHPEWRRLTGRGRTLWARGYYVNTVGLDEAVVRKYIRRQEEGSRIGRRRSPHVGAMTATGTRRSRRCRLSNEPLRGVNKPPGYAGGYLVLCHGLTISLFVFRSKTIQPAKKRALILFELASGFLLIADRAAYLWRGDPSAMGFWVVRISNFLVFFLTLVVIYALNTYGISLVNLTLPLAAVLLYLFVLDNLNEQAERARRLEIEYLKAEELETRMMFEQTAIALSSAIDAKDTYTRGHSTRVANYARRIAELAGKDEDFCEDVYYAGLLHDVGKIGIPDAIINKNGRLTDEEFEIIKTHPEVGGHILEGISQSPFCALGRDTTTSDTMEAAIPIGWRGRAFPSSPALLRWRMPTTP